MNYFNWYFSTYLLLVIATVLGLAGLL